MANEKQTDRPVYRPTLEELFKHTPPPDELALLEYTFMDVNRAKALQVMYGLYTKGFLTVTGDCIKVTPLGAQLLDADSRGMSSLS